MRRVVGLAFVWGWSFLFIKVAVGGMSPATVAFLRCAFGLAAMAVVVRVRRARLPRSWARWRHYVVMGVLYSAVPFTLLAWSEQHITSALASVVNATTPLFAAMVMAGALGERLRRGQVLGLVLGFVGVAVAAGFGSHDVRAAALGGVVAATAASTCYGVAFAYASRHLVGEPALVAATGQLVAATAILLPFAAITTATRGIDLDTHRVAAVALLGAVGTGFAYVVNYRNIAVLGATRAAVVTYLVPVVAVTVGIVFLHEPFRVRLVIGGGLTIVGIALLQQRLGFLRRVPVVAAVLGLAAGACGGGGAAVAPRPSTSAPTATTPACSAPVEERLDPGSARHVLPGSPSPSYTTHPPTSGPHRVGNHPAGALDTPIDEAVQVAMLEDGAVLIQYRDVALADVGALRAMAGNKVTVAPANAQDAPVVATAWVHKLTCSRVDDAALRSFVTSYQGVGASGRRG